MSFFLQHGETYSAMHIVGLRRLPELSSVPAVNHSPVHGDGITEDIVDELTPVGLLHGVDAALGESQIDGLGEVQWHRRWVPEIYRFTIIPLGSICLGIVGKKQLWRRWVIFSVRYMNLSIHLRNITVDIPRREKSISMSTGRGASERHTSPKWQHTSTQLVYFDLVTSGGSIQCS